MSSMVVGVTPCGRTLNYDKVALLGSGPARLGLVLHEMMALLHFPFCPKVAPVLKRQQLFSPVGVRQVAR